jgi:hypothetical protein
VPEDPEDAAPVLATPAGGDGMTPPVRPRRRVGRGLALVGLVIALVVGTYAFIQDLDTSSTASGMDTFCNSVGTVMQLTYDRHAGLGTLHKMVDKDAEAVGGRVLSDTRSFELALSRGDTSTAQKYLLQLDDLCGSEGSPISTPITTAPIQGKPARGK